MAKTETKRNRKRFQGARRRFRVLTISNLNNQPLTQAIVEEAKRFNWELADLRFLGEGVAKKDFAADGVLGCHPSEPSHLLALGPQVVLVGHRAWCGDEKRIAVVENDYSEVGRLAARHFLERGFRHVGCVNLLMAADDPTHPTTVVYQELTRCLAADGVACLSPLILASDSYGERREQFAAWLETVPRPVALLVWQDRTASCLCGWCREIGVSVPEEVAVLGITNHQLLCELSPCPLSSVDLDFAHQGREAVRLLQRMMLGEAVPQRTVVVPPSGVVTRRSTDILAVADVKVARALRFIWEHLTDPITVNDVAAAAGISRSTVERHFRQQIGRTVNQELLRKRLERCRELLHTTNLSIADIAPRSGFFSRDHLHRTFRARYGISPGQYRAKYVR